MRVVASRRTVPPGATDPDCDVLLPFSEVDRLAAEADYLVLAVPLTDETHHLIGAQQLAAMKPGAFILNVARGAVIDHDALVAALREGQIAGAALDVTDPEPLPPDNPLWEMENVIITPHVSGAIEGYFDRSGRVFAEQLGRFLRGEPLENVVDPALGY
jgi:phosphoglycerate dehydrogenase-like enzyme